ncbi:acetoacetyl-CoA synthetase [Plasticicumulans lactativorans]|uniref:Acetoacetyl-CoA synthetase n=1 Tax=Plasticicumulans lactativorans TaxID=1133106 RepID=A0A4R2L9A4_9GAMM|nr:acetoacetate--CoA ligase [Plasticicumulans lactativorans]TCO80829.1 acetoacetyl-CoA synthetase [Plasticicumulans lactativorans]
MTDAPLWQPSAARIEAANLTALRQRIAREHGVDLPDYAALYAWSLAEPAAFWRAVWDDARLVGEPGGVVLADAGRMPGARWFPEARLNFAENLLRRNDDGDALVFWGEDKVRRRLSWAELQAQVARLARALAADGVQAGDRVCAFMPNMPETVIGMLATASLGAIWSSCSPDFGVSGVLDRFGQITPKVLLACDGYHYNGKRIDVRGKLAEIRAGLPTLARVLVVGYLDAAPVLDGLADAVRFDDYLAAQPAGPIDYVRLPFDHPLYIMFSSGTTGVPKCIVHGVGGTLLQQVKEHRLHVDVKPGDRVFYFTTCGWMMWNWLVAALACEATVLLYDGSPFYPDGRVLFDYADAEDMDVLGTSAKYLDACAKAGLAPARTHRLARLRAILSTGSPLLPESFDYVYRDVKADVQLSSISGGTDILSCFALGNPVLPVWRGELQCRGLGLKVEVWDDAGRPLRGEKGELVCTAPFPSMPLGFWNDPDGARYRAAYFERFPGVWCHGDYVELTGHDGLVIYGRSDAVLNPGGVRIGTAEIYRQVERLDEVVESLVIGQEWAGDVRVVLFVRLREGLVLDAALVAKIQQQIRANTTPRHVPAKVLQVADIPRTKSGKIVELAVREVVHCRPVKNVEALANPEALALFRDRPELAC